jgi:hypothetical protein
MTSSIGTTKKTKPKKNSDARFIGKNLPFAQQTPEQQILTLRDKSYIAIRNYLVSCGWKELDLFDHCMHNRGHVVDPITDVYYPIDYAYMLQWQRDMTQIQKKPRKLV